MKLHCKSEQAFISVKEKDGKFQLFRISSDIHVVSRTFSGLLNEIDQNGDETICLIEAQESGTRQLVLIKMNARLDELSRTVIFSQPLDDEQMRRTWMATMNDRYVFLLQYNMKNLEDSGLAYPGDFVILRIDMTTGDSIKREISAFWLEGNGLDGDLIGEIRKIYEAKDMLSITCSKYFSHDLEEAASNDDSSDCILVILEEGRVVFDFDSGHVNYSYFEEIHDEIIRGKDSRHSFSIDGKLVQTVAVVKGCAYIAAEETFYCMKPELDTASENFVVSENWFDEAECPNVEGDFCTWNDKLIFERQDEQKNLIGWLICPMQFEKPTNADKVYLDARVSYGN